MRSDPERSLRREAVGIIGTIDNRQDNNPCPILNRTGVIVYLCGDKILEEGAASAVVPSHTIGIAAVFYQEALEISSRNPIAGRRP